VNANACPLCYIRRPMSDQPPLENSCGTCIACCYALAFNAEEGLKKKAGDMCPNCTGTGCGIYETRFKLCQLFLCAWRKLPQLGDDWRPDKSGVMLIEVKGEQIPEGYRDAGIGMEFLLLKDDSTITRAGFSEYVGTLVSQRVAVFMGMIGGPSTFINKYLEPLVAAKDLPGLTKMLLHIYGLHMEARKLGLAGPDRKKPAAG
jgi:hypothetical protein